MVYQLKPDPRDTAARRLPGLRELQQQKPIQIQNDKLPPKLGARTRSMTLLMTVLGLATFAVPLINTSIPVAGRAQWSPLLILEGLLDGSLPAAANLPPEAYHYVYELIAIDTILFGAMFAYGALTVILVSALRQATRFVIGAAAAFGMLAALLEMRGYADLQLALLGGTPQQRGGAHVVGFTYCGVLFIVMLLVLLVVTIKELEGIPS
ncbi:MAG TPA: hypothetical protein VJV22_03745 [Acidobacteriaceae bacterium]|nr:hypothetical protein [Acidobacteriaceae bacterium]